MTQTKQEQQNGQGNYPEKKIRAGAVSATIRLNKGQKATGEESQYRTISMERSYTDKNGNWQSTNSMRINDLPKATLVLQKAYEYLVMRESLQNSEEEPVEEII